MKRLFVTITFSLPCLSFAQNAKIKLDIERTVSEIDPKIYDVFMEPIHKAITADILNRSETLSGKAEASLINSDSLKETFSCDKQGAYSPVKAVQFDKNKLTWSFPPHSFTQIRIGVINK